MSQRTHRILPLLGLIALFSGACGSSSARDEAACTPDCRVGYACSAGVCVPEADVCRPDCRAGYACSAGTCVAEAEVCVPSCRAGYECSAGACVAMAAGTPPAPPSAQPPAPPPTPSPAPSTAACVPACRAGFSCDRGTCVPRSTTKDVTELGTVVFGGEQSATVQVQVPADAIGFHLVARTSKHTEYTAASQIVGPDGAVIFDLLGTGPYPYKVQLGEGEAVVQYPNASGATLIPGTYHVSFRSEGAPSPFSVYSVITRRRATGRGRLDLNVFLIGIPGIDAASARTDSTFASMLQQFRTAYAAVGVDVGAVEYFDVNAADAQRYGVVSLGQELTEIQSLSTRYTRNDHLNLYFVRSVMSEDDGFVILGVAGGIPGPASVADKKRSGVVISAESFREDPTTVANTMIHEAGHFLGLFHLSERDGSEHDPLIDTPECDASRDTNQDGTLEPAECRGSGTDNIMFWHAVPDERPSFSSEQATVISRNPAVR